MLSETLLNTPPRRRLPRASFMVAGVAAMALAAGCAKRDSITVGSVPDDYRTNHPIVISEQDKKIDIPVGMADRSITRVQRVAVDGFIADYDRHAAPMVSVLTPYGSANQAAAGAVAADVVKRLRSAGVPEGRIVHQPYEASRYGDSAPIRLIYAEMRASAGQCGRWPADMLDNADNRHWANFGCSYQNNLAAQIANPADLMTPRRPGPIDNERRSVTIDDYRERLSEWDSEVGIDW
jgi:pilus assembly protein CpaD